MQVDLLRAPGARKQKLKNLSAQETKSSGNVQAEYLMKQWLITKKEKYNMKQLLENEFQQVKPLASFHNLNFYYMWKIYKREDKLLTFWTQA